MYSNSKSEKALLVELLNQQGGFNYQEGDLQFSEITDLGVPDPDSDVMKEVNNQLPPNTKVTCAFKRGVKGIRFRECKYHRVNLALNFFLIYKKTLPAEPIALTSTGEDLAIKNKEEVKNWLEKNTPFRTSSLETITVDHSEKKITIHPYPESLIYQAHPLVFYFESTPKTTDGFIVGYGAEE